jgi:hypothetical protein
MGTNTMQHGPEISIPTEFFEADPSLQEHIRRIAEITGNEIRANLPKD